MGSLGEREKQGLPQPLASATLKKMYLFEEEERTRKIAVPPNALSNPGWGTQEPGITQVSHVGGRSLVT